MQLTTRDGIDFEVYETGPAQAERAALIVHDWWGVLPYNHDWAERLAGLGYRAMVVDLYDGENPTTPEHAGEMMRELDQEIADAKLLAALEHLKDGGRTVAVLGWSFGGRQAMQAALLDPETVTAVVLFYCRMVNDPELLESLGGPVLSIYAETERTWPDKMEKFAEAMKSVGKVVESHSFNAGHGFVNPGSERFDAEATEASWQLVEKFLRRVHP